MIVFDGTNCIAKMLDWLVTLKGEPKKVKMKIVKYELQLKSHNGGACDMYVILIILSNWYRILNIIKKWKIMFSLKK